MAKAQSNENRIDWYHQQQCENCDVESFYDEIEKALDAEFITDKVKSLRKCDIIPYVVKRLLILRILDPAAFDLLCIKVVYPEMTYEEITDLLKAYAPDLQLAHTRKVYKDRARVADAVKEATRNHDELKKVFNVDDAGNRKRHHSIDELLAEKVLKWITSHEDKLCQSNDGNLVIRPRLVHMSVRGIENAGHCKRILKILAKKNKITYDHKNDLFTTKGGNHGKGQR